MSRSGSKTDGIDKNVSKMPYLAKVFSKQGNFPFNQTQIHQKPLIDTENQHSSLTIKNSVS